MLARAILRRGNVTPEIMRQLAASTPDMKHMLELLAHPPAAFLAALPPKLRAALLAILVSLFALPIAIFSLVIADLAGFLGWPS